MLCKKPFRGHVHGFGCRQCNPCRINRRRLWSHKIMLESFAHTDSAFVTLTYAPEYVPSGGTLVPKHAQDWLKRLRKAVYPAALRYFLVGEYGDESNRPHYHLALFGFPSCAFSLSEVERRFCRCRPCGLIRDTWKMGFTDNANLESESASYIAGYVVKKMTAKDDSRLGDRHPEFARMSLKPGIGAPAMKIVAESLKNIHGQNYIAKNHDVPDSLHHGGKNNPLGRYLRRKLRAELGLPEKSETASIKRQMQMYELLESFKTAKNGSYQQAVKSYVQQIKQKILNVEGKTLIFRKAKRI